MGAEWVGTHFDLAATWSRKSVAHAGQAPQTRVAGACGRAGRAAAGPPAPAWQFQLIEDVGDGSSALIARIHHCIADGIALIAVMLSITGQAAGDGAQQAASPRTTTTG